MEKRTVCHKILPLLRDTTDKGKDGRPLAVKISESRGIIPKKRASQKMDETYRWQE